MRAVESLFRNGSDRSELLNKRLFLLLATKKIATLAPSPLVFRHYYATASIARIILPKLRPVANSLRSLGTTASVEGEERKIYLKLRR